MKKTFKCMSIFLTLMLLLSGCGAAGDKQNNAAETKQASDAANVQDIQLDTEESDEVANVDSGIDAYGETADSEFSEAADIEETGSGENEENTEMNGSKILVAYFSATGTTKRLAGTIAEAIGGDLYEIVPEEPYTDDDLNYNDNSSRTTIEQNDSSSRPAISGSIENFDDYDIIFLGYPIWWYDAPHIMFTFAESYDFDGKNVIPFCTSGGSGIGTSGDNIEACAGNGTWLYGTRMSGSASDSEVSEWIDDLGITLGE